MLCFGGGPDQLSLTSMVRRTGPLLVSGESPQPLAAVRRMQSESVRTNSPMQFSPGDPLLRLQMILATSLGPLAPTQPFHRFFSEESAPNLGFFFSFCLHNRITRNPLVGRRRERSLTSSAGRMSEVDCSNCIRVKID